MSNTSRNVRCCVWPCTGAHKHAAKIVAKSSGPIALVPSQASHHFTRYPIVSPALTAPVHAHCCSTRLMSLRARSSPEPSPEYSLSVSDKLCKLGSRCCLNTGECCNLASLCLSGPRARASSKYFQTVLSFSFHGLVCTGRARAVVPLVLVIRVDDVDAVYVSLLYPMLRNDASPSKKAMVCACGKKLQPPSVVAPRTMAAAAAPSRRLPRQPSA